MLTLTVKLLICSSFIFIYLNNKTTLAENIPFSNWFCEIDDTVNSMYQRNLDTALSTLPSTNSGLGFFNFSTGQGNDTVHSAALCRGDVNPDVCQSCLSDSIIRIRNLCPNHKESVVYYEFCLLSYSNNTDIAFKSYAFIYNDQKLSDGDQFNVALRELLNDLKIKAAAGGPLLKFATGARVGPGGSTIYAHVQCTPDLSEKQCNDFLTYSINLKADYFNGTVSAASLRPMCTFRYVTKFGDKFYNDSRSTAIPPASVQLNPPISPPDISPTSLEINSPIQPPDSYKPYHSINIQEPSSLIFNVLIHVVMPSQTLAGIYVCCENLCFSPESMAALPESMSVAGLNPVVAGPVRLKTGRFDPV